MSKSHVDSTVSKEELARAKRLSKGMEDARKKAHSILRRLESEDLPDESIIDKLNKTLEKDEKEISKLLKPVRSSAKIPPKIIKILKQRPMVKRFGIYRSIFGYLLRSIHELSISKKSILST